MPWQWTKSNRPRRTTVRAPHPGAGLATLEVTRHRLDDQADRLDRLQRRRLALLVSLGPALALYAIGATVAVATDHAPTAIIALALSLPLLALAVRAATLAWTDRELPRIGPSIGETIAHTPGAPPAGDVGPPSEATPSSEAPHLSEVELRHTLARWNEIRIDANEARLARLGDETRAAARWTLATTVGVALALITLGVTRVVVVALDEGMPQVFFVG